MSVNKNLNSSNILVFGQEQKYGVFILFLHLIVRGTWSEEPFPAEFVASQTYAPAEDLSTLWITRLNSLIIKFLLWEGDSSRPWKEGDKNVLATRTGTKVKFYRIVQNCDTKSAAEVKLTSLNQATLFARGLAVTLQVWSLTQFYSVDFSQSRIGGRKSTFSTNGQSRFASVVLDHVLEHPCLALHTW